MTGLDAAQRVALERLIVRARSVLEQDLEDQAEGRYGINRDGTIEDEAALHLDPSALADRREIVAIVEHLRNEGESETGAVARLIREAAFTHLNRLVAIRVAEAMGLVPPSLADGRASQGFREVLEVAPLVAGDETGGYWTYLRLCGDEMASDAPVLFDPRNPLLTLSPGVAALDELVTLFSDSAAEEIWTGSDTFGWAYQFFNTGDERRQMREESPAPRNSRELAVRNQFFTPRYVVDFLVQNTLGRRLLEAEIDRTLVDALPLLIDPPTEQGEPLPLDNVRILDPACGSGHFLLGCYDLLERGWQLEGVEPAEAAPLIVPTLWGVDIDPRCAQVASAGIVFRARRHCRDLPLPRPNVITARALADGSDSWVPLLASLPTDRRDLVQRIQEALAQAHLLGPLLKVEERLAAEIRRQFTGSDVAHGTLAEGIAPDAFGEAESEVLAALQRAADSATSSAAERLLAAEAGDAIRFVEAMRQRYDVVLMNPPFGDPAVGTEEYLRTAYSEGWTELYASFVQRAVDLLRQSGRFGAITSSQYFVTRKLRSFRRWMIAKHNPAIIVDLGPGILEGATVNTALMVLDAARPLGETRYVDLTHANRRSVDGALLDATASFASVNLSAFAAIDNNPIALHIPPAIIARWERDHRLEPDVAIVRTGSHTFDDFRFLRCRWEIPFERIGSDWRPFQKGGPFQPYFSPSHLVVDWRNDGAAMKESALQRVGTTAQVMQSSSLWGRAGLTYAHVSSVGFGVRVLPAGEIFSTESISIFSEDEDRLPLLAMLNSTVVAEVLQVFGRGRKFENGSVKALPIGRTDVAAAKELTGTAEALVRAIWSIESIDETSSIFVSPYALATSTSPEKYSSCIKELAAEAQDLQAKVDDVAAGILGVSEPIDVSIARRPELLRRTIEDGRVGVEQWAGASFSYLVGVAFGRWDADYALGDSYGNPGADLFAPISPSPPGMRRKDGSSQGKGSRVDVPPSGILLDEEGHEWDVAKRFLNASESVFDHPELELDAMLSALGASSVRQHLRRRFFRNHLVRYSKSRRKAPIYWPLAVPSRNWGMWVYAPRLSRETLFAIAGEASRREALAAEAIRRLQAERDAGGTGRSTREVSEALGAEEALTEELGTFRREAERLAGLGWEPDLDDGIILCAAPLASLFPAWPDAAKEREQIRKGEYLWATVSRWRDAL